MIYDTRVRHDDDFITAGLKFGIVAYYLYR